LPKDFDLRKSREEANVSVRVLLISCAMLIVSAVGANAQIRNRMFVEGGVLVDQDAPEDGSLTVTAGGVLGGGVRLPLPFTLRIEAEVPRWHTTTIGAEFQEEVAFRAISYAFLVAGHFRPLGRVQLEPLAGFNLVTQSWRWRAVDSGHPFEQRRTRHWPALSVGIDAPVAVTRRLAVVPQLRVSVTTHSTHYKDGWIRLRMALRWQF
jgi:hypothetical protein